MDEALIGKWIEADDQSYPGLTFEFFPDGAFEANYDGLAITSGGTYTTHGNEIDMNQTHHNFGLVGKFHGLFQVNGNELRMILVATGEHDRPADLTGAVIYYKSEK